MLIVNTTIAHLLLNGNSNVIRILHEGILQVKNT